MASDAMQSVTSIEFPETPKDWKDTPAVFKDGKLTIHGHPVMEDWEHPYMKELAAVVTRNGGVVLEVGFGMGISATYIQKYPVDRCIIIEANADVYANLEKFAKTAPHPVEPRFGLWQDVISSIPNESLDGVLFDAYPLSVDDVDCHFLFFEHAFRVLKKGGVFTYYSDEATDYSPEHLQHLRAAGFEQIEKTLCEVDPPADCKYWQDKTFLTPIVKKS